MDNLATCSMCCDKESIQEVLCCQRSRLALVGLPVIVASVLSIQTKKQLLL